VESVEIITRGFASPAIESEITAQSRTVMAKTLEESSAEEMRDYGVVKEKIRQDLKRFIVKSTARRPLILPVILEI
jgi:ribonuclease J